MRQMQFSTEQWPLKEPFVISRSAPQLNGEVLVVEIHEMGKVGRGECERTDLLEPGSPNVVAEINSVLAKIEAGITRQELLQALPPGNARNAIDCALFELEAKLAGISACQLAQLQCPPRSVTTVFTLSLDTPENMAKVAKRNKDRPILKLKLGRDGDLERVDAVHTAAPNCRLVIDANTGWSLEQLKQYLPRLKQLGVEMVEQPLPVGQDWRLKGLNPELPICADESCIDRSSLDLLEGCYQVVNVKLDKTGGMTEALELIKEAKLRGFEVMVGCMIGTSLAMAPALLLAQEAKWVDIDGPLLLAKDHTGGLIYQGSNVHPSDIGFWG